jgi:Flp pilus assembly protein TadG
VEFGLLAPVLFLLLFGIIDYGIWFADSISARQAVRDSARRGVVEDFGSGCSPAAVGANADLQNLSCSVQTAMGQISGSTRVRVSVATAPAAPTGGTWAAGAVLRVCSMTQHSSLLPMVPLPNSGISVTRVDMPIERATAGTNHGQVFEPPPFAGATWAFCP